MELKSSVFITVNMPMVKHHVLEIAGNKRLNNPAIYGKSSAVHLNATYLLPAVEGVCLKEAYEISTSLTSCI